MVRMGAENAETQSNECASDGFAAYFRPSRLGGPGGGTSIKDDGDAVCLAARLHPRHVFMLGAGMRANCSPLNTNGSVDLLGPGRRKPDRSHRLRSRNSSGYTLAEPATAVADLRNEIPF